MIVAQTVTAVRLNEMLCTNTKNALKLLANVNANSPNIAIRALPAEGARTDPVGTEPKDKIYRAIAILERR